MLSSFFGAVSRALNRSFAWRHPAAPENRDLDPREQELVGVFDALDGPRYDEVAKVLFALWSAFLDQFEGLDGFLARDEADRRSYVDQLNGAAARLSTHRDTSKGHLYYAVQMMASYVEGFGQPASSADPALAARVATAIERGQALAGLGPTAPASTP